MTSGERAAAIGSVLAGKYELVGELGRGGMGVVYEAVNGMTGRHVALKVLPAVVADDLAGRRLMREARAATAVEHPNVVQVLDVAVDADFGIILVMELLRGESLSELLERSGPISMTEAVSILSPIAAALTCAHSAGVLHRDLKPSNIFLHVGPSGERIPKLVDFGIARADGPRLTQSGATGTPGYMAPEQMQNAHVADERADIWAFAVVVHECLCNKLPFPGTTPVELMANVLSGKPVSLETLAERAPTHVVAAVQQALNQDPALRPASVGALTQSLGFNQAAAGPLDPLTQGGRPESTVRMPEGRHRPARTRNAIGIGIAASVILLCGGAFLFQRHVRRAPVEPPTSAKVTRVVIADGAESNPVFHPIQAGSASIGSSPEEQDAALGWCRHDAGSACDAAVFARESPRRAVSVHAFLLGAHEVTNREFVAWLAKRADLLVESSAQTSWLADHGTRLVQLVGESSEFSSIIFLDGWLTVPPQFLDLPVVSVTRLGAQRYCEAQGARLPTGAEWEWAARGSERREFPWGNALFSCRRSVVGRALGLACAEERRGPQTVREPMQDQTPAGITGLAGNVAEWVADSAPREWASSGNDGSGTYAEIRGGDWHSAPWFARGAARRAANTSYTAGWLGFRCAVDAEGEPNGDR